MDVQHDPIDRSERLLHRIWEAVPRVPTWALQVVAPHIDKAVGALAQAMRSLRDGKPRAEVGLFLNAAEREISWIEEFVRPPRSEVS